MKLVIRSLADNFYELKEFWNKDELLSGKRLLKFVKDRGLEEIEASACLDFVLGLKLAAARKDIAFLCLILELQGENPARVHVFKKAALRRIKKVEVKKRQPKIATEQNFKSSLYSLINKNKLEELVFLCLALNTGRRGIDLVRLKKQDVSCLGEGKFLAKLEWDKRNSHPVFFTIKLSETALWTKEIVNINNLNAWLLHQSKGTGLLFRNNIQKNLNRYLNNFNLHSLRSVRAVWLLLDGLSEQEVKLRLGWSDDRSFLRYIRTTPEILRDCDGLDGAVNLLKEHF